MSVWDDDSPHELRRAPVNDEPLAPSPAARAVAELAKAHDEVRLAAHRDAADIVARARRDIRRIVTDARRELLELSAQVQAANVELPDASLPDPSLIEADADVLAPDVQWAERPALVGAARDTGPTLLLERRPEAVSTVSVAGPRTARAFVALFALAGVIVLAGTVWWVQRTPVVVAQTTTPAAVNETADGGGAGVAVPTVSEAVGEAPLEPAPAGELAPAGDESQPGPPPAVQAERARAAVPAPSARVVDVSAQPRPQEPPAARPPTTMPPPPGVMPGGMPPPPAAPAVDASTGSVPAQGAASGAPVRVDIAAAGRQWIDAYHRQDRAAMEPLATPSVTISDERRPDQRFPFGLEVTRAFSDEQLQLAGDSALFAARVTERASTGAFISRVSQTWVRRLGEWQLQDVRLIHEGQAPPLP